MVVEDAHQPMVDFTVNQDTIYRDPGGPGWALVGDAFHQKNPLDGQGIYNTLFTAQALAQQIQAHRDGQPWPQALDAYAEQVHAEVDPMFRVTMGRIAREVYLTYPDWFAATVGRWLYADKDYLERWIRLLIRDLPPDTWFSYPRVAKSVLVGAWNDLTT